MRPFGKLLAFMLIFGHTAPSFAQVTANWNGTSGNWTDFTRWSTNPFYPNNGNGGVNYDAVVSLGGVTVDTNIVINNFALQGGSLSGASHNLTVNGMFTWLGDGFMAGNIITLGGTT